MTCATSGLVDHVHQDPAEVDRSDPERRDRSEVVERVASGGRSAASLARRCIQLEDAIAGVTWRQTHRVVGVIGTRPLPRRRHVRPEQPALEPAVLGPCQVLDDPADRHVRCGKETSGGLLPRNVDERSRCDRSVLIESLDKR
jgi:hypothetical protein